MNQAKPILFYSSHCIYSKEIIDLLQKYNCINDFNLINISIKKYMNKLPPFVKAVPCIYVNKQVLNDDDVENFIRLNFGNKIENIDAFFPSEMNSGIGNPFSYIGDENSETTIKNNMMYIDDDYSIQTPDADPFNSEGANGSTNINTVIPTYNSGNSASGSMEELNRYQQMRDADLKKMLDSNGNAQNRQFVR